MKLVFAILLILSSGTRGDDINDNLPPCPTNMHFFPQSLPMHCKMTFKANNNSFSPMAAPFYPPPQMPGMGSPQMFQSMPSGASLQMMSPGQAGGGFQYPGMQLPQMPMMSMSGMPGLPLPLPPKPPMVVMPYYAPAAPQKKKKDHKKQKPYSVRYVDSYEVPLDHEPPAREKIRRDSSDWDLYDSLDMGDDFDFLSRRKSSKRKNKNHQRQRFTKKKSNARRADPLTPVLQYVSKDGYVIYEKELSQHEARDYLTEKPTATTKRVVEERFAPVKNTRRIVQDSQSTEDTYDDQYHDFEDKRAQASGKDRKNHESDGGDARSKKSTLTERILRKHN